MLHHEVPGKTDIERVLSQGLLHLLLEVLQLLSALHLYAGLVHWHPNRGFGHVIGQVFVEWQVDEVDSIFLELVGHQPY